jgi:primosomal protein N' (replication factor Y)
MPVPRICQLAIPSPLRRHFDYLAPKASFALKPGMRLRVPFGRRTVIGVLLALADQSPLPRARLKAVLEVLDAEPLIPEELFNLLVWAADYYHHPIGEVLHAALPVALRQGAPAEAGGLEVWSLTSEGRALPSDTFKRAPRRKKIFEALAAVPDGLTADQMAELADGWRPLLRGWREHGWVNCKTRDCLAAVCMPAEAAPELMASQGQAVAEITQALGGFRSFLLHGITGSGKTEVYLHAVEAVLRSGGQALVLVPEIALTHQLIERFQRRFPVPIALLHSGLSDQERLCAWLMARAAKAPLVLGTRSAVFAPLPNLKLIVVDEEHDGSYKQQDGFRYSARDVAILRARSKGVPIVLGSATPSLESLNNAWQGRYRLLGLPERTGDAALPAVRLLDLRRLSLNEGLSPPLVEALAARLRRGEQSLLFLNRRGFAPVLICHACGWLSPCPRCDAKLTFHKRSGRLRCHHCGTDAPVPQLCPACNSDALHGLGEGTQRIEAVLARLFPSARIERIDRDSTRRKGALAEKLERIHAGDADILVGTQMLAKGHDFPNLTLVGVIDADQGLYSADFRGPEGLFQRVAQVAGRAGRAEKPGEVFIQTYHPEHPLFAALQQHDYTSFARYELDTRREAQYPPFAHLALLRAESPKAGQAMAFLNKARSLAQDIIASEIMLMEPVPSPMERRAGRYRAQCLVQSAQRPVLHAFLANWLERLDQEPLGKKVRWSLDVDPLDLY